MVLAPVLPHGVRRADAAKMTRAAVKFCSGVSRMTRALGVESSCHPLLPTFRTRPHIPHGVYFSVIVRPPRGGMIKEEC